MGHTFIGDGVKDILGRDVATADHSAAQNRHHPGVVPAVAVKQRHNCQIDRMQGQPPGHDRSHGHEISAAVVIDHALGTTRRA